MWYLMVQIKIWYISEKKNKLIYKVSTKPGRPGICLEFECDLENMEKAALFNKNLELFLVKRYIQNNVICFSGLKFKSWLLKPSYSDLSLFQNVSFQVSESLLEMKLVNLPKKLFLYF